MIISTDIVEDPLVSIIIPCYNHERYIEECFKSLLAQTYRNIEILIADDCSRDGSVRVIEKWIDRLKKRFVNVCFIKHSNNLGIVKTINGIIPVCKGKYIKILASDDMLFPDAIWDLVTYLEKNSKCGIVYSNHVVCKADEKYNIDSLKRKKEIKSPGISENMTQSLYENDFIIAPTVLTRREVYDKIGLHDENLSMEDWEFWIRVSINFRIGYLNRITAAYRIVSDSLSRFTNDAEGVERFKLMIENEFKVLDKYKDYPYIDSSRGIRKCCDQGISIAIDFEADEIVKIIKDYLRKNCTHLSLKMEVKYICYHLKLWKIIKMFLRKNTERNDD